MLCLVPPSAQLFRDGPHKTHSIRVRQPEFERKLADSLDNALLSVEQCNRALIKAVFSVGLLQRFVARMWGVVVILGKPKSRGRLWLRRGFAHPRFAPAAPPIIRQRHRR